MAFRYDVGSMRPPQRMPDGRLRADAAITRAGVFVYRNPDGTERREYRPRDEVFKFDSLSTFADVPVTDDHPPEMLTARNARQYAVGHVSGAPRRDGDMLLAQLVIIDEAVVAKMDAGKTQLSCGYECDLELTPGVSPEGERYDAVQRAIRGNHVALVDVGRAGPEARVRMDAATMISGGEPVSNPNRKDSLMNEEVLKQLTAATAELAAAKVRADDAEKALAAEKARADKAEADRDAEKVRADKAEKARTDAADALPAQVRARVALETAAVNVLGAEVKLDSMDDRSIKLAVVKRLDGEEIAAERSAEYVDARYDAALRHAGKATAALAAARTAAESGRNDSTASDEATARARMIERNRNAHTGSKE